VERPRTFTNLFFSFFFFSFFFLCACVPVRECVRACVPCVSDGVFYKLVFQKIFCYSFWFPTRRAAGLSKRQQPAPPRKPNKKLTQTPR